MEEITKIIHILPEKLFWLSQMVFSACAIYGIMRIARGKKPGVFILSVSGIVLGLIFKGLLIVAALMVAFVLTLFWGIHRNSEQDE